MKRVDVDNFEKLVGQMQGVYDEVSMLSKKSPNDAVNKFKLGFINSLLKSSNEFLGKDYLPFPDFSLFDVDSVPQNSDAVFILSQYLGCFEKYRADRVQVFNGIWFWAVDPSKGEKADDDGYVYVRTVKPKRLRE